MTCFCCLTESLMNQVSRRRFLKITGAGAGVAAAAGTFGSLPGLRASKGPLEKGLRTVPTFCDLCFWKCGAIATVRDGVLWKIEGNPDDPLSRGRLCPRGHGRRRAPTSTPTGSAPRSCAPASAARRSGPRSPGTRPSSHVAEKMLKIKAEHGPEAVALFSHGIGGTFLKHTVKAFGSPNSAAPSFAQCRGPRDVGFELTFGEAVGSPERTDIRNARCLVLIGSHLGENMHNTQVQEFAERGRQRRRRSSWSTRASRSRPARRSTTCPIKPGTDIALLLAWMNVLVARGALRQGLRRARTASASRPSPRRSRDFTPEWAYPETGIEPDAIRETAREMARHRPATLVHPGRHATWYGDDAQRSRAIALLNALLGSWGRKGGFYQPASMDVPALPVPALPEAGEGQGRQPGPPLPLRRARRSRPASARPRSPGKPYPVKGWLVYATNLMQALPNEAETIKAIQALDLLVVVDVVGSEIAGWADVVLPEATYLERYDELNVELFREPFVALRQPVVAAAARPEAELVDRPGAGGQARPRGLLPLEDDRGVPRPPPEGRGPEPRRAPAARALVRGTPQPIYYEEGVVPAFATPSEKIEFYSVQLKDAGFDPVPEVHAARGRAARLLPPALRPRPDPHVQPHPDEPRPRPGDGRERGVGERRRRPTRPGLAHGRPRAPPEPGRRPVEPDPGEGHRGHPPRLRLHGPRLRPHREGPAPRARARAPATPSSSPATRPTRSWAAPA